MNSHHIKNRRINRNNNNSPCLLIDSKRKVDKHNDIEMLKGFEPIEAAKERRDIRIDVLGRSKVKEHLELCDILASCTNRRPCCSPACPICFRDFRKGWYAEAQPFSEMYQNPRILTIIYYSEVVTDEELGDVHVFRLHNRLRKQLGRAGFKRPVIGFFEIDYHEENKCWLPH